MSTLQTITQTAVSLKAFDEGDDIKVIITAMGQPKERWFTRYIASRNETFPEAAKRVFKHIADEMGTTILPII